MKGTIFVKERYEVKSTLFGDDYIDTKDGPAYIRHSLLGDDYIETKDGPAFRKHIPLGDDYFEMPKKKDSGSTATYIPFRNNIKITFKGCNRTYKILYIIDSFKLDSYIFHNIISR